jgi:hypothetical protein
VFYRYSYAMNDFVTMGQYNYKSYVGGDGVTYAPGLRIGGWTFTGKISSIKNAGQIEMLICEDEQTVDDGSFTAAPFNWGKAGSVCELVASRHDTGFKGVQSNNSNKSGNMTDAHGDEIGRKDALRGKFSGSPARDPNPGEVPGW